MTEPTPEAPGNPLDGLTKEESYDFLASHYGVHRETFHALTLADWEVFRRIHAVTEDIKRLRIFHGDDNPTIEQTVEGLRSINPIYITDAALRRTDAFLQPPTEEPK